VIIENKSLARSVHERARKQSQFIYWRGKSVTWALRHTSLSALRASLRWKQGIKRRHSTCSTRRSLSLYTLTVSNDQSRASLLSAYLRCVCVCSGAVPAIGRKMKLMAVRCKLFTRRALNIFILVVAQRAVAPVALLRWNASALSGPPVFYCPRK
jgi:hypothetical protein